MKMSPTNVIDALTLSGTRAQRTAQKRTAIRQWLATDDGAAYLALLQAGQAGADSYNNMVREEANLRDPRADAGQIVKSKRGTYARQIGARAAVLTMNECHALQLQPGPGNY